MYAYIHIRTIASYNYRIRLIHSLELIKLIKRAKSRLVKLRVE